MIIQNDNQMITEKIFVSPQILELPVLGNLQGKVEGLANIFHGLNYLFFSLFNVHRFKLRLLCRQILNTWIWFETFVYRLFIKTFWKYQKSKQEKRAKAWKNTDLYVLLPPNNLFNNLSLLFCKENFSIMDQWIQTYCERRFPIVLCW